MMIVFQIFSSSDMGVDATQYAIRDLREGGWPWEYLSGSL
jgi:hypothetical protein